MTPQNLAQIITKILDDLKAENCSTLNIKNISDVADFMVICSASSGRHLHALAKHLTETIKQEHQIRPSNVSGNANSNWILLDFGSVLVQLMLPEARNFYALESLWEKASNISKPSKAVKKPTKKVIKRSIRKPLKSLVKKAGAKKAITKNKPVVKFHKKTNLTKIKSKRRSK